MKYNHDIDYIRRLLDKYYRAETLPEEEEILESFFREANPVDIPNGLESEQKMFALIENMHPSQEESLPPDDLLERLSSIVEKPVAEERIRKKFHKGFIYFAGSVAACIIIGFLIVFMQQHNNDAPNVRIVAETKEKSDLPVLEKIVETKTEMPEVGNRLDEVKLTASNENEEAADGFIEITDPEEAREILQKIGQLLAQNAEDTNDAMANISNSIDSYKEISKSILQ